MITRMNSVMPRRACPMYRWPSPGVSDLREHENDRCAGRPSQQAKAAPGKGKTAECRGGYSAREEGKAGDGPPRTGGAQLPCTGGEHVFPQSGELEAGAAQIELQRKRSQYAAGQRRRIDQGGGLRERGGFSLGRLHAEHGEKLEGGECPGWTRASIAAGSDG